MKDEEKVKPTSEKPVEKVKTVSIDTYQKAVDELEKLKNEVAEWKNKYYRAYADTDNLRKSIEKDHNEALRYRSEGFIENLMPALDGFHLALMAEPKNDEMKAFLQGFQYIYKNIMDALQSEGVSEIDPKVGDKFDVSQMHALDTVEQEGPENVIVKVYAKGYKLHDRIIRPAMVFVSCKIGSKKKEEVKEEKVEDKKENSTNKDN